MKLPHRRQFLHLTAGAATLPLASRTARAQAYPARPITLVVHFSAGGGSDITARVIAEKMSKTLGQQIIVENRPGAGGTVAVRQVAKSAPDGYTLGLGNPGTLAVAPSIYPNLGYDPRKDFAHVGLIGWTPFSLIVHPSLPTRSVQELIAIAKASPGTINFGSAGTSSGTHLTGELFASMADIKIMHVPYRGVAPAINDLLGGHVKMVVTGLPPVIGHIKDGVLHALAVTSVTRASIFPNVPTVSESGLPGYESVQTFGLLVAKGTPPIIVDKLNVALREALDLEEVKTKLSVDGTVPQPGTPEDYAAIIDREETKWSKIIKQIGLKAN